MKTFQDPTITEHSTVRQVRQALFLVNDIRADAVRRELFQLADQDAPVGQPTAIAARAIVKYVRMRERGRKLATATS